MSKHTDKRVTRKTYIPVRINDLLHQRAIEEKVSESALICKALTLYLTKDIEDESLLIAKMTELQRQTGFIEKKLDLGQKLEMQWMQFLLCFQSELPSDQKSRTLLLRRGSERFNQFLSMFKDRAKSLPSMLESLLADMLEEDVSERGDG
jgi:hypothetical protein